MAEGLAAQTTDEAFESTTPAAVDMRKQNFAQLLGAKVEQGYKIESQGDTEAVLFTRGRRSWFGLFAGRGERVRQMISVDDKGAATTRKLSPNETTEFGRTQYPCAGRQGLLDQGEHPTADAFIHARSCAGR